MEGNVSPSNLSKKGLHDVLREILAIDLTTLFWLMKTSLALVEEPQKAIAYLNLDDACAWVQWK